MQPFFIFGVFNRYKQQILKHQIFKIKKSNIELAKQGNEKAMYALYQDYGKAMYNICLRMTNCKEDAEDVLQEAFTDAFQKLNTYNYEASFGAWLKRIVLNRCLNALRVKKPDLLFVDELPHAESVEEVDYEHIELEVEKVNRALMQLPTGYRVVCSLYLLEGYDHREISQIMDISESTSKSQYLRAKKKLKEILLSHE